MRSARYNVCAVLVIVSPLVFANGGLGQQSATVGTEYVRITNERAQKIVAKLELKSPDQVHRIRELVASFYRDLHAVHAERDAKLKTIDAAKNGEPEMKIGSVASVRNESEIKQFRLHYAFLAKLAAELPGDEIEQVKNGLTYDVVPKTYHQYLQLYPNLTLEQQRTIHGYLLEAREHAIDAGSSDEKHGVFGKYKGRINNYLSAAGFDAKQAERDLRARKEK